VTRRSWTGAAWELSEVDQAAVERLAEASGLSALAARCVWLRGGTDPLTAKVLLEPALAALHDPYAMSGMDVAVARLRRALADTEHVRVVTDYDVDGTTSSLILQSTLKILGGGEVSYHIPDRKTEGYGFSIAAAEQAAADGVALIVTADIGVKDHDSVAAARRLGVDVIVCDHHLPQGADVPPEATAVLCPPQIACSYPNQALAACGVSLKLAQALLAEHPKAAAILDSQLKLAAIGTVADVVDLSTPENRAIVALGLASLNRGPHAAGLAALLRVSGLERGEIGSSDLGFRIGPRINAAGRMAHAAEVIDLFTTRDRDVAAELAGRLDRLNSERKGVQQRLERLAKRAVPEPAPAFVVVGGREEDGWHRGVVGIVAARLRDRYHRPAAVYAVIGDSATGSVRSTRAVHAVQALEGAGELLERYGGHAAAAGFTAPAAAMPEVAARLAARALELTGGAAPIPVHHADGEVAAPALGRHLHDELARLAPHGKGNAAPRLVLRARLRGTRVLKGAHLKAQLHGPSEPVEAIWWSAAEQHRERWRDGAEVELLGRLGLNRWRGRETLQVTVEDARDPA